MSFVIAPQQHQEWFIAVLLPHIRQPLMQHKVTLQEEALEIVMKLEASPIAETSVGMAHIPIHHRLEGLGARSVERMVTVSTGKSS